MQGEETLQTSLCLQYFLGTQPRAPLPRCDCPLNTSIHRADTVISQTSARAWRLGHRLFLSPSLNYLEDRAGALNPSCLPGVARLMPLPTLHHYFFHLIWGWLAISRLLDSRNRKTEALHCAAPVSRSRKAQPRIAAGSPRCSLLRELH